MSDDAPKVSPQSGRRLAVALLVFLDANAVLVATTVGYFVRFEGQPPQAWIGSMPLAVVAGVVVYVSAFALFHLYRVMLRYVGVDTLLRIAAAALVGFLVLLSANLGVGMLQGLRPVPIGVLFIQFLLTALGAAVGRLSVRIFEYLGTSAQGQADGHRVLIVGAGDAGSLLLRDIESQPALNLKPVGFLDDDPRKKGLSIRGVQVMGSTSQLAETVARLRIEEVLVALPSAPPESVRALLNEAAGLGVKTRIMPRLVVDQGSVSVADLRKVEVEDLLGREPAPIDVHQVAETIAGKVVAVTGAAGSIGSELCRQILTLEPSSLLLLDVDETRLYELWLEFERTYPGVTTMHISDVRDAAKLVRVFSAETPALVLHAAAYKHVPLMELEPDEAVRTNVLGTRNVIDACEQTGVERFVLISTDKAVNPSSVMGATKALAERVMLDACARGRIKGVAVRFGNVLGSRGSVIPLFQEQLRQGGPIRVTHEEATRYFMTIPEAARLVLQAQAISDGGDLFVLEMGEPVRIYELAQKMIALSGIPADIEVVGLRPAEKLHEVLVTANEELIASGREKILLLNALPVPPERFREQLDTIAEAVVADPTPHTVHRIAAELMGAAVEQRA